MLKLNEIENILKSDIDKAYEELMAYLEENPSNAQAWYMLGGIYRSQELWGEAINAYNKAKLIEPDGPAATAIDSIYDILRFFNKDMMNP